MLNNLNTFSAFRGYTAAKLVSPHFVIHEWKKKITQVEIKS